MKCIALLLLASCGAMPDYFEASPSYSEGGLTRVGSMNTADSSSYGVMFTFGWDLNENRQEAWSNLARLDVDRSGRLTLDDPPADAATVLVVPQDAGEGDSETPVGKFVAAVGAIAAAAATWWKLRIPEADIPAS